MIRTLRILRSKILHSCILLALTGCAGIPETQDPYDSGGVLLPEQAAYDVEAYDLAVEVFPETKSIEGAVTVTAKVLSPLTELVLNLDPLLGILGAYEVASDGEVSSESLSIVRRGGQVRIRLPRAAQPGDQLRVLVRYGGVPREAPNPPWSGGFTWKATADGQPWISTTCQGEGADIWWPVKDHVSDRPDRMSIEVTVPEPLIVASNGKLAKKPSTEDGRTVFRWEVSTPISVYNVALNIAPYVAIHGELESVAGGKFPVVFYVLPEDEERGREFFPEILDHLRFFEETVGPYPFRQDKYGVAQTPHLGMEHQTITGYGARFERGAMTGGVDWGFDVLHHHELSHEWWGNLVTNSDWSDMWIHEGFGTYMQPLYIERTQSVEKAREYLASIRKRVGNKHAMAPRGARSSSQIYGGDIYFKGAWVLHTLRYLIGDEKFFHALRRMAYPSPEAEADASGASCRFVTTEDFVDLVEYLTGSDLSWFFEVYVRNPPLPRLEVSRTGDSLFLNWQVVDGLAFPMPVPVKIGDEIRRVPIPKGGVILSVPEGTEVSIDPDGWLLRDLRKESD